MTSNNKTLCILHSIINLLYLACLCITIYFSQHRQRLMMMGIQITRLRGFSCLNGEKLHNTKKLMFCLFSGLNLMCLHSCSHGSFLLWVCLVLLPSSLPPYWCVPGSSWSLEPITHFLKFPQRCAGLFENNNRILLQHALGRHIVKTPTE